MNSANAADQTNAYLNYNDVSQDLAQRALELALVVGRYRARRAARPLRGVQKTAACVAKLESSHLVGGGTMKTLLAALVFVCATAVQAQTFPTRPVTIIIPYPPGGLIVTRDQLAVDRHPPAIVNER